MNTLSTKVVDTSNNMIEFGENSVPLRNSLVDLIDEGICSSFAGGNANPLEQFDTVAESLVVILTDLQNFAANDITTIRDIFATDVNTIAYGFGNTTDSIEVLANPAYYGGPTVALGVLLFVGLMFAWVEVIIPGYFFVQSWITMQLFLVVLTVSIAAIAILTAVLVANSGKL